MTRGAHKPERDQADPAELLLGFLDYCRSAVARKIQGLSEDELRTGRLPSGYEGGDRTRDIARRSAMTDVAGWVAGSAKAMCGRRRG